jgi:ATP-dependent DNA helicase RecG
MVFKSTLVDELQHSHIPPYAYGIDGLVNGLVENQKKIIILIKNKPTVTIQELSQSLGISTSAIDKNLKKLKEKNIIRRVGNKKNGGWVIVSK